MRVRAELSLLQIYSGPDKVLNDIICRKIPQCLCSELHPWVIVLISAISTERNMCVFGAGAISVTYFQLENGNISVLLQLWREQTQIFTVLENW